MAARGVGRERRINESGIEQTGVAFDVKLKCRHLSRRPLISAPLSRRLPPGCSERPRMRTRASLRGFFFSVMGERFAAIRIDLARKIGTLLFASIADRAKPRLRPESGAFSFCRSGCSDQDFAAFNLSAKRRLCNTVGKRFIDGARRCCAVFTARSRAAATTNLARSSQSLVLSALFFCAAAKSWATANVFMISPPGRAAGS